MIYERIQDFFSSGLLNFSLSGSIFFSSSSSSGSSLVMETRFFFPLNSFSEDQQEDIENWLTEQEGGEDQLYHVGFFQLRQSL